MFRKFCQKKVGQGRLHELSGGFAYMAVIQDTKHKCSIANPIRKPKQMISVASQYGLRMRTLCIFVRKVLAAIFVRKGLAATPISFNGKALNSRLAGEKKLTTVTQKWLLLWCLLHEVFIPRCVQ